MSSDQTVRGGARWLVGSGVVGQIMTFVFSIVLARLLVPADFGMIVTIQIFTGLVGLVASGGMGQALIRAKEAPEQHFQVIFTIQLAIGTLIYTCFAIIAPWFADWFGDPRYKDLLRISALSFVIRPFLNLHNIWLQREMRFKATATRSLVANITAGIFSIAMAMHGWGVWSLVWGGLLGSFLSYFLVFHLTPMHARLRFDQKIARQHSAFGFKIIANELISYLRAQTSNLIVTRMSGAAMVGLFNKGDSLSKLPFTTISSPIYQPVFRAMSVEQNNPDMIKYLFFRMISLLLLYTLPIYIGLWWLAEPFIVVVYGDHWADAAVPLEILAPLGLLYCIGHPCGAVLAATNRLGQEIVVQTITWAFVAVGCYYGLNWGLAGVAYALVLSQIYSTIHMYVIANQSLRARMSELLANMWPPLTLNGILVAVLIILDLILSNSVYADSLAVRLFLSSAVGALAYTLAFLFIPIPPLAEEAMRWKKTLRLAA